MILKPKTLSDVENTFDFMLGVIALAKSGDMTEIEDGAFEYSRLVLNAAEHELRMIEMYDATRSALNVAERLVRRDEFMQAYKTLQTVSCELMKLSGTADEMRHLFDKLKSSK